MCVPAIFVTVGRTGLQPGTSKSYKPLLRSRIVECKSPVVKIKCFKQPNRKKQRERERERERDRQTDRQTDRQRQGHTETKTDRVRQSNTVATSEEWIKVSVKSTPETHPMHYVCFSFTVHSQT